MVCRIQMTQLVRGSVMNISNELDYTHRVSQLTLEMMHFTNRLLFEFQSLVLILNLP